MTTTVSIDLPLDLDSKSYFRRGTGMTTMREAQDALLRKAADLDIGGLDKGVALDVKWGVLSPLQADSLADALRVNVDKVLRGYEGPVRATYAPQQASSEAMQPIAHIKFEKGEVTLERIELGYPEHTVRPGLDLDLDDDALRYVGALAMARARGDRGWNAVERDGNAVRQALDQIRAREAEPEVERPKRKEAGFALH